MVMTPKKNKKIDGMKHDSAYYEAQECNTLKQGEELGHLFNSLMGNTKYPV